MFGLIGKIIATDGDRDKLIAVLIDGTKDMPGCISYVVAQDSADPNALWVTEVWQDQEKHKASLTLPAVQRAIADGRPLMAGFGERFTTTPIGGQGI